MYFSTTVRFAPQKNVGVWTCLGAKNWILTHASLILGLLSPVNSTFPLKKGRNFFATDVWLSNILTMYVFAVQNANNECSVK